MASVFYSAVDWRVTKNEDGGEVKEKFEVPPAIEFHVRDKLPWVELIKGAGQFHTKPETFTLTRQQMGGYLNMHIHTQINLKIIDDIQITGEKLNYKQIISADEFMQ